MNRLRLKLGAMLASSVMLAGCCPTLSVAPHAIRCNADAELLAHKCPLPNQIPDDATFQAVVDAMRSDRQALRDCGISLDALRDSINRCNQTVDDFNKKIDEINAKNKNAGN